MSTQRRIRRLFNIAFGSLAMLAVGLVSAFVTMRLAIHGREVQVPALARLTVEQARERAASKGLSLVVENRFYSTGVAAGLVLSQLPSANETVRRDTQIRVTESLGAQHVTIPDVVGQGERAATIALRRLGLELGPVAYLTTTGAADTVLAQTPPPNAEGIDGPRVSLLVSQSADPGAKTGEDGVVTPSVTGLSAGAAQQRLALAGLHVIVPEVPDNPDGVVVGDVASGNVIGQYPAAGHRSGRNGGVRLTYAAVAGP